MKFLVRKRMRLRDVFLPPRRETITIGPRSLTAQKQIKYYPMGISEEF